MSIGEEIFDLEIRFKIMEDSCIKAVALKFNLRQYFKILNV